MSERSLVEYFTFLDELRSSGETNMFGAAPYIQDEFSLTRDKARKIVMAWMKTFDPDKTLADRAAAVKEQVT